jgi:hypothetical protein
MFPESGANCDGLATQLWTHWHRLQFSDRRLPDLFSMLTCAIQRSPLDQLKQFFCVSILPLWSPTTRKLKYAISHSRRNNMLSRTLRSDIYRVCARRYISSLSFLLAGLVRRVVERCRARQTQERPIGRQTYEERKVRAAITMVDRGRRKEGLEKENATPGRCTSNKRKFPKWLDVRDVSSCYKGRLMDGKHILFVPLETSLSLPCPFDGYVQSFSQAKPTPYNGQPTITGLKVHRYYSKINREIKDRAHCRVHSCRDS